MNFTFEKKKLKTLLGEVLYKELKKHEMILAGGAITSLFTNSEINDFDIYSRREEDVLSFLTETWEGGGFVVTHTKKATLVTIDEKLVQLIHFNYYQNADEVFKAFDFTVCMGAFDFKTEEFVLHPDFMKHNSQRVLRFNPNTDYPIVSAIRSEKYQSKGYSISKAEYVRIIMTCMTLEINSYDELKEHLGGMYGVNLDKLFEDVKDEEFDLSTAIEKIANITLSDEYFIKPTPVEISSLDELLESISNKPRRFIDDNGSYRKICFGGALGRRYDKSHITEKDEIVTVEELIGNKLYKFVKKVDTYTYSSYYNNKYHYKLGEVAVPSKEGSNDGKLYFNPKELIVESNYFDESRKEDCALIEVEFEKEDIISTKELPKITLSKCKVVREVPKEEWSKWINYRIDIQHAELVDMF